MKQKILYIFTRTPLHVGAGSSVGAVDMPVQRERHTGFPIIPGSSIKGVLADGEGFLEKGDKGKLQRSAKGHSVFGKSAGEEKGDQGNAGAICFGEAQLLAFPVRSAKGCFAWLTSPLALKRWERASGKPLSGIPTEIKDNKAYFCEKTLGEKMEDQTDASALFEDYVFHCAGAFESADTLAKEIEVDGVWKGLAAQHLVLVSDHTLSHFARTGCEVAQHVVIDDETGTAKGGFLFNQENVPSETLFFAALTESKEKVLDDFAIPNPLQLGGNATTGLGFCSTSLV